MRGRDRAHLAHLERKLHLLPWDASVIVMMMHHVFHHPARRGAHTSFPWPFFPWSDFLIYIHAPFVFLGAPRSSALTLDTHARDPSNGLFSSLAIDTQHPSPFCHCPLPIPPKPPDPHSSTHDRPLSWTALTHPAHPPSSFSSRTEHGAVGSKSHGRGFRRG